MSAASSAYASAVSAANAQYQADLDAANATKLASIQAARDVFDSSGDPTQPAIKLIVGFPLPQLLADAISRASRHYFADIATAKLTRESSIAAAWNAYQAAGGA